ncbi:hypothetical protein COT97_05865 [Candidatus Falkowbacteria bacterium CG10_big_fil_rev_8_21_14_0_10_39_11]|uniref:GMP synthase n=1 Tax=Candidatus Falkowbacteria bacterium CG10_big_fil_rev_8_21_14_0_10_39_11 TaxID=1974565 RepID=A0A2H0V3E4_9BACT|nr:MAG: hypothetical protein COT97_05865 [Candidatus Falkowbacteria bacterium CG10_big_fil_rev_8_21_14_0_10_39_11]
MSLTRSLEAAKKAYKKRDVNASIKAHQGGADHEHHKVEGQYIKSLIYGGLDGIITTFAIVAGVAGASLSFGIVLILGFANLIADGISMAVGDYLSSKAENEYKRSERKREEWEVDNHPDGEKLELVELYQDKGIAKPDAEAIVNSISKYKEAWLDIMMVEELQLIEDDGSPVKNAFVTFFSFQIFGFIPLIAYVFSRFIPLFEQSTFIIAALLTAITLFILGALKVKLTDKNWFKAGLETLVVGGLAAGAAYGVGVLLAGLA